MGVKDIVRQYENSLPGSSRTQATNTTATDSPCERGSVDPPDLPPPTPARFLRHPLLRDCSSPPTSPSATLSSTAGPHNGLDNQQDQQAVLNHSLYDGDTALSDNDPDLDSISSSYVVGQESMVRGQRMSVFTEKSTGAMLGYSDEEDVEGNIPLLPVRESNLRSRAGFAYPISLTQTAQDASEESTVVASDNTFKSPTLPGTSRGDRIEHKVTHLPIPLTTIFARDAAPLYLPKLDDVISLLPKRSFTLPHRKVSSKYNQIFPPMDLLAASGQSLEDLENNSKIAPGWRNRTSILSGLVDVIVGVAVRCDRDKFDDILTAIHRAPAHS
jgi:hypothetical protein